VGVQGRDGGAREFLPRIAQHAAGGVVHLEHASVPVHDPDAVHGRGQDAPLEFQALPQFGGARLHLPPHRVAGGAQGFLRALELAEEGPQGVPHGGHEEGPVQEPASQELEQVPRQVGDVQDADEGGEGQFPGGHAQAEAEEGRADLGAHPVAAAGGGGGRTQEYGGEDVLRAHLEGCESLAVLVAEGEMPRVDRPGEPRRRQAESRRRQPGVDAPAQAQGRQHQARGLEGPGRDP